MPQPNPPDLELLSVTRLFDRFAAVSEVNLEVARGEFVAIMGPSGCGKTTLLRILAGLETMTSGQLHIRGRDVSDVPCNKRSTRLVWQNYALFPHLDVFGNIAFGLTLGPYDRAVVSGKVKAMAALVGLEDFLDRRIGQLSGGQKQRVALARALVTEPEILLLDEPLAALDAHLRLRMQGELRRIQKSLGLTFIYVTHNQVEAFSMADRVVVMNRGRIEQVDTPERIYAYPRTNFVARFVGANNIFDGIVSAIDGDGVTVACAHGPAVVTVRGRKPGLGEKVSVVVQADKLKRLPSGSGATNAASAVLRGREFAGSQNIYLLDLIDGTEIKLIAQESMGAAFTVSVEETWTVALSPDDAAIIGYADPPPPAAPADRSGLVAEAAQ